MIPKLIAFVFATFFLIVGFARAEEKTSYLNWKNGDAISGELVSADQETVYWQSDLFRGNLEISIDVLKSIRQPIDPSKRVSDETYFIRTKTGDKLYGELTAIDEEFAHLSSKRHGNFKIRKTEVAQIAHLKNAGFVLLGPTDLGNWGSLKGTKKHWEITDAGQLQSNKKNSNIFLKTDLPDAVQIELEIKWLKKLDFLFGLGVPSSTGAVEKLPRIETWEDSIVLTHDEDFEILYDELDKDLRSLKLYIIWDRNKNRVFVNDESGKQLCDTELPKMAKTIKSGIFIQNKREYLSVESLRIGKVASGFDPSKMGVHKTDGEFVECEIVSFDGKEFQVKTGEATRKVEVDEFREAILLPPAIHDNPDANLLLRFQDGSIIRGKLDSIQDKSPQLTSLKIHTPYTPELLESNLSGAATIRFDTKGAMHETGKQLLFLDNAKIQGEVVGGTGEPGDVLRWKPVGSRVALPLGDGAKRIEFNQPKEAYDNTEWPDTLYFKNCDMIPCRVVSIDDQQVRFESFTENKSVSATTLKAIDFSPLRTLAAIPTDDKSWFFSESAKNKTEVEEDKITIRGKGHFGHPSLASARKLKFDMSWKRGTYTILTCKMFVRNLDKQTGGIPISFIAYDQQLQVAGGEVSGWGRSGAQVQLGKNSCNVTLTFEKGKLNVYINEEKTFSTKVSSKQLKGRGVVFDTSPLAQRNKTQFSLSNFIMDNESAGASPAVVDPIKKELLLTIPRVRKDNPSEHIVCARNGDLLRGRLIKMDDKRLAFESRLENFTFNRDILASIVWIHADDLQEVAEGAENGKDTKTENVSRTNAPSGDDDGPKDSGPKSDELEDEQIVQVMLLQGQRITLVAKSFDEGILEGHSVDLGNCRIPASEILEIRQGDFANKATDIAYSDWIAKHAPEPKLEDTSGANAETASPLIGTKAKDFTTKRLDGSELKLSSLRGRVVVLDFWATWCGPCIRAMPDVVAATASFKPEEVVLVAVNQLEKQAQIKAFVESKGWDVGVALDENGSIGESFNVLAIPKTIIIDREGKIVFVKEGGDADLKNKLTNAIRDALEQTATH